MGLVDDAARALGLTTADIKRIEEVAPGQYLVRTWNRRRLSYTANPNHQHQGTTT